MATTYGNYEVLYRLAAGGMGEVFLAQESSGARRKVALKRIFPHLADDAEHLSMFLDEARIAGRLDHPNLARMVDLGVEQGSVYLAFEFVQGGDLRRIDRRCHEVGKPLPLPVICHIGAEVCRALDYAHSFADADTGQPLGIVHRDITPQNIMVSMEGEVKVVDFGIAKAADSKTRTLTGVVKGKQPYMSPEQASGDPVDHRSDIFSLGIVLYELATGQRLFKRETDFHTLEAVMKCEVKAPSVLKAGLPASLDAALLKALEASPGRRFASAGAFGRALEEVIATLPDAAVGSRSALGALATELLQTPPRTPPAASATDKVPAFVPSLPRTQDVSIDSIVRAMDGGASKPAPEEEETIRPGAVAMPRWDALAAVKTEAGLPGVAPAASRASAQAASPLSDESTFRGAAADLDRPLSTTTVRAPAVAELPMAPRSRAPLWFLAVGVAVAAAGAVALWLSLHGG